MEQDYEEVVKLLENELAEVRMQASKAMVCFRVRQLSFRLIFIAQYLLCEHCLWGRGEEEAKSSSAHINVKVMQLDQGNATRLKSCQKNPREAEVNQNHSTKSPNKHEPLSEVPIIFLFHLI